MIRTFIIAATGILLGPLGLSSRAQTGAPAQGGAAQPPKPAPAEVVNEAACLSNIRQLTFKEQGLDRAGEGYFSPDMKTIIFQAYPVGVSDYQIYTLPIDAVAATKPKMVSTGKGACTCAFFRPDGKKIIFASTHLNPDQPNPAPVKTGEKYAWPFHPGMDVFEADPDGGNLKRLTDAEGYDAECSYSPDGKSIVFCSQRDGDLELYMMDADGKNPRRLTYGVGYDGGPFFSVDGKTILYRADRKNTPEMLLQIRMIDADGKNDRALTDNNIFNWAPYYHPSGKYFIYVEVDHAAYSRGERPNYDLFLMNVDGKNRTRVTSDPEFDGLPVFSPDGKKLMWTSKRNGLTEAQLFIADWTPPKGF